MSCDKSLRSRVSKVFVVSVVALGLWYFGATFLSTQTKRSWPCPESLTDKSGVLSIENMMSFRDSGGGLVVTFHLRNDSEDTVRVDQRPRRPCSLGEGRPKRLAPSVQTGLLVVSNGECFAIEGYCWITRQPSQEESNRFVIHELPPESSIPCILITAPLESIVDTDLRPSVAILWTVTLLVEEHEWRQEQVASNLFIL